MTDKLFENYLRKQLSVGIIKEEDISVFRYGYVLMIEILINLVISIMIGVLLGEVIMVIAFLIAFIPIRSFAGGYHADKAWKCILLSNTVIALAIYVARFMYKLDHVVLFVLIELLLGLVFIKIAPVQSSSKKLSAIESSYYKKIVLIIYAIEIMEEIISFQFGYKDIACIILIAHVVVTISLIAGRLLNKTEGQIVI